MSMTMADILSRLPDGRKECLELELAEKLARENKDGVDELQLAALLGKTLLEKNSELELKLKRLQEFAEETLVTNQTLSRQLNESRDSLQFSNKSCEQLELRTEELEKANKDLRKLCDSKQSTIDQKTAAKKHLEDKLDHLQEDYSKLQEECASLEESITESPAVRSKSSSFSESANFATHASVQEISELKDTIGSLTLKLQNTSYQKQKFESELREVLSENQALGQNLERAELEIAELHARLRVYEEASERQRIECSPTPQKTPTSTPSHTSSYQHWSTSDESPLRVPKTPKASESGLGTSLFSELDTQYTDLQLQYEDLLQQCTCSASLSHTTTMHGGSAAASETDDLPALSKGSTCSSPLEMPFKMLFDEMFATLKQTAQVADRLIERKKITK